ncbi:ABC transporter permease, partial [Xanthovirga aplysinae]|uniref:ABC transporter permease n=1 Tax=Xanthovirga aplysinae TaxID=2529853 RepID=UPI0012BCE078
FPEVQQVTRIGILGTSSFTHKEKSFKVSTAYTDSTLFDVFTIPLIKGDPETALTQPNSLIIDETTANKIFGKEDPLGKTLLIDQNRNAKITGVFKDIPQNSHFHYNAFFPMVRIRSLLERENWLSHNFYTYLVLNENASPEKLEVKFPEMLRKTVGPVIQQFFGASMEEMENKGTSFAYSLQPVKDIHLLSNLRDEHEPNGSITYVYIFSAIAFIILLIACTNYINLTTARSAERAKEVGIRKSVGAFRSQLLFQFLSESLLLSIISLLLAIGLVDLSLPAFNYLADKPLTSNYWDNGPLLITISGVILFVGTLSGAYPAFILSSTNPAKVLKGNLNSTFKGSNLRSTLVVLQFSISIFLMIGTGVIYKQLNFIRNTNTGFQKEQLVTIHDAYTLGQQAQSFKKEILKNSVFKSATVSGFLPVSPSEKSFDSYQSKEQQAMNQTFAMDRWAVDYDYLKTLGMEMAQGRFFSPNFPSDSSAIVVNESTVRKLGFDHPIGQRIMQNRTNKWYTIIGVVKNFNFESLKENIGPLAMVLENSRGAITIRFEGQKATEAIALLQNQWNMMAPGQPFKYSFLDDRFNS